jgi:hypothetical protein
MNALVEWAFSKPARKIGFEDILHNRDKLVLINTLPSDKQGCLIKGTLNAREEEEFVNDMLTKYTDTTKQIVLYGLNACDESPYKKQRQLLSLGISEVWVYAGGLFEWSLLQDIYGETEFPTTVEAKSNDPLKWRPSKVFST